MPTPPPRSGPDWVVIVPVKPPARGKSRLTAPSDLRVRLASAFALDTVAAVLDVPHVVDVLAVTDDVPFAASLSEQGCTVIPDGVGDDLNATLVQAALEAMRRRPDAAVAALCADLPALRTAELAAALTLVPDRGAAYVADTARTGTTLYAARHLVDFAPAYGVGSAAVHRAAGALPLDGDWPSLRQDVDEVADLDRALALGVGRHTRAAYAG